MRVHSYIASSHNGNPRRSRRVELSTSVETLKSVRAGGALIGRASKRRIRVASRTPSCLGVRGFSFRA